MKATRRHKSVPLPQAVAQRWLALAADINMAAKPYIRGQLVLSPFYLHEIIGAEAALDKALASMPEGLQVHGSFALSDGKPCIELSWWEGAA